LPEGTFSFRRSWRRTNLEGLVGSLSDVPLLQKWSRRCASASLSYDRSLQENVITLSCVLLRVPCMSTCVSCRFSGASCRRMGVSGWKMMEERYSTI
jgi:hypothetical protein